MTAEQYKKKLKQATKAAGTYQKPFEVTIDLLSKILAEGEAVYNKYIEEGRQPLTEQITDRGSKNLRPNPLLKQWNELNAAALSYLSALGLNASSLKRIQADAMKTNGGGAFDTILDSFEESINKISGNNGPQKPGKE